MMKLKQYINEADDMDTLIPKIRKDCGKLIDLMNIHKVVFQRYGNFPKIIGKNKTQKNRVPRDTMFSNHEIVDKWFKEEFGWNARSEHVLFANLVKEDYYINEILVFPIRPEKFIWSPIVKDLTLDLEPNGHISLDVHEYHEDVLIDALEDSRYMDLKPGKLFSTVNKSTNMNEVMIKCKEYWYINFFSLNQQQKKEILKKIGLENLI